MLISITLKNWRSHKYTSISFKQGTNLFIGAMGSGKSSVLDAISYALFGTFPLLEKRRISREDIFRFNSTEVVVSLIFEHASNTYKVLRTLTKSLGKRVRIMSDAKLYENGSLIARGQTEVSGRITSILGVNYSLFTRAIYSEQNNIDYFMGLDPSKRKLEIDRLLGMDRFEAARSNIVSLINMVKAKTEALSRQFDVKKIEDMKKEYKRLIDASSNVSKEIESLSLKVRENENALKDAEKHLRDVESRKNNYDRLTKDIRHVEGRISALKSQLDILMRKLRIKDISNVNDEKERIERQVSEIKASVESMKAKSTDLRKRRAGYSMELGRIDALINRAKEDITYYNSLKQEVFKASNGEDPSNYLSRLSEEESALVEKIDKLSSDIRYLKDKISEEEEYLHLLSTNKYTSCPLCGNPLDERHIHSLISDKRRIIADCKNKIMEIEMKKKTAVSELNSLRRRIKVMEDLVMKYTEWKKKVDSYDVADMEKKRSALEERIKNIENNIAEIDNLHTKKLDEFSSLRLRSEEVNRSISISSELNRLHKLADAKYKERNKICSDESLLTKEYEVSKKAWADINKEYERALQMKISKEKELNMINDKLNFIKNELSTYESVEKEISRLNTLYDELSYLKKVVLEVQVSTREELVGAINTTMDNLWRTFYPYSDYSSVRIRPTEKDYVFELKLMDTWRGIETIASGGERACVSLTFRVALAVVLTPKLSWLILDEPTHNLDKNAVELLSHTLQYNVPEVILQAIVITHDETLMGDNFGITYRFTRDKGKFAPTVVEEA